MRGEPTGGSELVLRSQLVVRAIHCSILGDNLPTAHIHNCFSGQSIQGQRRKFIHWPMIYPVMYELFPGHTWTGPREALQHLLSPKQWKIPGVGGGRCPVWTSSEAPVEFNWNPCKGRRQVSPLPSSEKPGWEGTKVQRDNLAPARHLVCPQPHPRLKRSVISALHCI